MQQAGPVPALPAFLTGYCDRRLWDDGDTVAADDGSFIEQVTSDGGGALAENPAIREIVHEGNRLNESKQG